MTSNFVIFGGWISIYIHLPATLMFASAAWFWMVSIHIHKTDMISKIPFGGRLLRGHQPRFLVLCDRVFPPESTMKCGAVGRRTDVILLTSTRTCPRLAFPNQQPFASLFVYPPALPTANVLRGSEIALRWTTNQGSWFWVWRLNPRAGLITTAKRIPGMCAKVCALCLFLP